MFHIFSFINLVSRHARKVVGLTDIGIKEVLHRFLVYVEIFPGELFWTRVMKKIKSDPKRSKTIKVVENRIR